MTLASGFWTIVAVVIGAAFLVHEADAAQLHALEKEARLNLQTTFPARRVAVQNLVRIPTFNDLYCASARLDRYSYTAIVDRRGGTTVVRLQPSGQRDVDELAGASGGAERLWKTALLQCSRATYGKVLARTLVKDAKAPSGAINLLEIAGRRLAIPAGNWQDKVFAIDSEMFVQEDILTLRGKGPAWAEIDPSAKTAPGFGDRIRDLAFAVSKPDPIIYTSFKVLSLEGVDILSREVNAAGEQHFVVRARGGRSVRAVLTTDADLFVDDRRLRLTICGRRVEPHRHGFCKTSLFQGGLVHELTYGLPYKDLHQEIADNLLAKLDAWEAAGAAGGSRYKLSPRPKLAGNTG